MADKDEICIVYPNRLTTTVILVKLNNTVSVVGNKQVYICIK